MAMRWSNTKGSGRFGTQASALKCAFKIVVAEEVSGGDLCVEGLKVTEEVLGTAASEGSTEGRVMCPQGSVSRAV